MSNENFEKEEVRELAEQIYTQLIIGNQNDKLAEESAKLAIKQAMIFRKAEREIFGEEK